VATQKIVGWKSGVVAGLFVALVAATFWYGLEFYMRRERASEIEEAKKESEMQEEKEQGGGRGGLTEKIQHALTECRVVLPGSQALLGFQFIVILSESFDKLSSASKYIHLASLGLNALTIVLL